MAKLSKTSVEASEQGPGTEWASTLEGYRISIVATTRRPTGATSSTEACGGTTAAAAKRSSRRARRAASRRDTRPVPRAHSEFVIFSPADVMAVVEEGLKRTLVRGRAAAA